MKRIVYAILVIMWMGTVFYFSNQASDDSSKSSGRITEAVVKIITKEPENAPQELKERVEVIVRKTAHFSIYALGAFLIAGLISTTNVTNKNLVIISILLTALYACSDEIHQLFIPGRSCEVRDIFIDTLGASLGTTIYLFVKKLTRGK